MLVTKYQVNELLQFQSQVNRRTLEKDRELRRMERSTQERKLSGKSKALTLVLVCMRLRLSSPC